VTFLLLFAFFLRLPCIDLLPACPLRVSSLGFHQCPLSFFFVRRPLFRALFFALPARSWASQALILIPICSSTALNLSYSVFFRGFLFFFAPEAAYASLVSDLMRTSFAWTSPGCVHVVLLSKIFFCRQRFSLRFSEREPFGRLSALLS